MSGGIPNKKFEFRLAEKNCDYARCLLSGSDLYVWYEKIADGGVVGCIKKFSLERFSGEGHIDYDFSHVFNACSYLSDFGRVFSIRGGCNAVLNKEDASFLYAESDTELSANGWATYGSNFVSKDFYYRHINILGDRSKGYDAVDIEDGKVVGHVDLDIECPTIFKDDICVGFRASGFFAGYSISQQQYVFEVDTLKEHYNCDARQVRAAYAEGTAAILCGNTVILVDVERQCVIKEINYTGNSSVLEVAASSGLDQSRLIASDIDFDGAYILLVCGTPLRRCMVLLDAFSEGCLWATDQGEINVAQMHGDIIYGSMDKRPTAWDRYSGAKVWEASVRLPCYEIQVGSNWLIYYQEGGHIACYRWKKPYISPHRPA